MVEGVGPHLPQRQASVPAADGGLANGKNISVFVENVLLPENLGITAPLQDEDEIADRSPQCRQHVAGRQGCVHPGPYSPAACRRDQGPQTPREQIVDVERRRHSAQHLLRERGRLAQSYMAAQLACEDRRPGIPSVHRRARLPDAPPAQVLEEQGIVQSAWQHPDQQVQPGPTADARWPIRRKHLPEAFAAQETELSGSLEELRLSGSAVNAIVSFEDQ